MYLQDTHHQRPNLRRTPSQMAQNINIYTKSSSLGGRGLFAAAKIIPGQLVLGIPEPLVTVPDDAHLSECCSRCMVWKPAGCEASMLNPYADKTPLSYCAGCRVVKYCGKECQRADWHALHRVECAIFKILHPRILPGSVRAVVRMLWTTPSDTWDQIRVLECHEHEFRRSGKWEMVTLMAKGAHGYSGTILEEEEVRWIYAMLLINSITLVNPTFDPIGIAFDPLASLINHSCDPNSVMVFDGRALSVRALREIVKGEEVTISYIENTTPTHRRRAELQERYFFICSCHKCISSTNSTEPTESFLCLSRSHRNTPGSCHCVKPQLMMPMIQKLDDEAWELSTPSKDGLLKGIKALHAEKIWPLQRQPLPSLHHELIHSVYIPSSSWPEALQHSLLLHLYVDPVFYPQRHHPVRVTHVFTLACLFLQVSGDLTSLEEVAPKAKGMELNVGKIIWGLLCETVAHVGLSHGMESTFAETVRRKKEEVGNDLGANETTGAWVGKRVDEIGLDGELKKVRILVEGLLEELRK